MVGIQNAFETQLLGELRYRYQLFWLAPGQGLPEFHQFNSLNRAGNFRGPGALQ